jgi:methionyl-tRNA formyltransferase
MLLNAGIDEGKLIAQNKLGINHYDNLELTHRLVTLSDSMLQKYIPQYLSGEITPYNQSNKIVPTYSRKLSKEDGKINWNKSAEQIEREIRAFIHWPKSFTEISGIPVIITKVSLNKTDGLPGTIVYDKRSMNIKCLNGSLDILSLKPLGRSDMNIASFISGYKNRFRD